jgi:acetate kinase
LGVAPSVKPIVNALVLNAGSSTLKWAVLRAADRATLASGTEPWSESPVDQIRARLAAAPPFEAIGHRVVHGGDRFRDSVVVDAAVRAKLGDLVALDDLHMKPALAGIDAAGAAFPRVPQVAAFDTAFHATLPPAAATYALPRAWTERWKLRRYGFHGLSVDWSVERLRALAGTVPPRLVVCHLGSGCSMTAVTAGRSVDTTMGYTPLEGLVMGTRAGSVDPGLILHLLTVQGVDAAEIGDGLSILSGLLGVSGISGDLREVLAAADAGDPHARLAYEIFVQSLRRGLGAMAGVLAGKLDAVVFTGGIGENSARVRRDAAAAIPGLTLIECKTPEDAQVSIDGSSVQVWVIHAREDLVVLREILRHLTDGGGHDGGR